MMTLFLIDLKQTTLTTLADARKAAYGKTLQSLWEGRGAEMQRIAGAFRSQRKLLKLVKGDDKKAIAEEGTSVWNRLSGQEQITSLFFWNAGRKERLIHHVSTGSNAADPNYEAALLLQIDGAEKKTAGFGLEIMPNGRLGIMQVTPFYNKRKAPYNMAVIGAELDPVLAQMKSLLGVTSIKPIAPEAGLSEDRVMIDGGELDYDLLLRNVAGKVIGAVKVREDFSAIDDQFSSINRKIGIALGLVILIAALISWRLSRDLVRRVRRINAALDEVGRGVVTHMLPVEGRDELDSVAGGVNGMVMGLRSNIRVVGQQSDAMSACVAGLGRVRGALESDATAANHCIEDVASANGKMMNAFEEIRSNMERVADTVQESADAAGSLHENIRSIAAAAGQVSGGVNTVAAASEQMHGNVSEVRANLERVNEAVGGAQTDLSHMAEGMTQMRDMCVMAGEEVGQASERARNADSVISRLDASAEEIGKVVGVIKNIADQTNMLALNASIEAAGAGEAGKGFAVVANEVKGLAQQTGDATAMISKQIGDIQANTREASRSAREMAEQVIGVQSSIQEIIDNVAEQQGRSEQLVAHMDQVAEASQGVMRNAHELDAAAQEVARTTMESANGANEIAHNSEESAGFAASVAEQSRMAIKTVAEAMASVSHTIELSEESAKTLQGARSINEYLGHSAHAFALMTRDAQQVSDTLQEAQSGFESGQPPFDIRAAKAAYLDQLMALQQLCEGRFAGDAEGMLSQLDSVLQSHVIGPACAQGGVDEAQCDDARAAHRAFMAVARRAPELKGTFLDQLNASRQTLFVALEKLYEAGIRMPEEAMS
ncbi:putative methyl-accepting chemotaxis sensory transducer [Magnetofaba australis IT-1]|uniref:Putative methyl-accepting chemotaxis sensory transducer n=2 Tax=Magnetofaba TaxID=1472292 RepID=A0A1Y2K5F1_9PROT|nr:putative methyl-accepting chemotaxis sensory transducer [Magnetofaba australis IT-1]